MTDEAGALVTGMVLASIVWLLILVFADTQRESAIKREAVKVGAAIYVADEDGDPVFTWVKAAKED